MRIVLINPPCAPALSPPLGVPSLCSYLKAAGLEVLPIDASIEAIHDYLSAQRLTERFRQSQRFVRNGVPEGVAGEAADEWREWVKADFDNLLAKIQDLWGEDEFRISRHEFESQLGTIDQALRLASLPNFPHVISLAGFDTPPIDLGDEHNPFRDYYRERLIPRIKEFGPDLIGISYNYLQQYALGRALARMFPASGITVPVVAGGAFFSRLCKTATEWGDSSIPLGELPRNRSAALVAELLFPFGVQGEGERPLLSLCRKLARSEPPRDIPGLVHCDRGTNTLIFNPMGAPLPPSELPPIDLRGLPLGRKYLTPLPMAPLLSSRGCYWNRCAFCDHATLIDSRFRELPLATVLQTLRSYQDEFGVEAVFFCDEGMSPAMLGALGREIPKAGIHVVFGTMTRIAKALRPVIGPAAEAGLKFLSFGLESGNARIVSLMDKGYTHETAAELLDECESYGVMVEYHVMFGFPTESREEAEETVAFLAGHQEKISWLRANPWFLTLGSPVGKGLSRYGIVPVADRPVSADPETYRVREGITHAEAAGFVERLRHHPDLGSKMVSGYRTEEFFFLEALCRSCDEVSTAASGTAEGA